MKRKIILLLSMVILCSMTSSCASKLTTIRPTLIDRIIVKDVAADDTVEIIRKTSDELDWQMDDIVFQMEQIYKREGKCTETDGHLYVLELYMNEKLELNVYINSDGSICKNGSKYVQVDKDENIHPVVPADYQEILKLN